MSRKMWQVAGACALGYVVLTLAGVVLGSKIPELGASRADVVADFTGGSAAKMYIATYVSGLALFAFVPLAALLSRALHGVTAAIGLIFATFFAVLFALDPVILAALVYAGHHGADAATLSTVNTMRNVVLTGSYLALGGFTLTAAAGALATGALPRWVGYVGLVSGIVLFLPPLAGPAYLLSLAWMVALGVVMLARRVTDSAEPVVVSALA